MTDKPISAPVSAFLPPRYRQQLILAAATRDYRAINDITDELAAQYPGLVRPRTEAGRFDSMKANNIDARLAPPQDDSDQASASVGQDT